MISVYLKQLFLVMIFNNMHNLRYCRPNISKLFLPPYNQCFYLTCSWPFMSQKTENRNAFKLINRSINCFSFASLKSLSEHPLCLYQLKEADRLYLDKNYGEAQGLYIRALQIYRQPSKDCGDLYAYALRKIVQCAVRTNNSQKVIKKINEVLVKQSYNKIDGNTKMFLSAGRALLKSNSTQINPQMEAFKTGSSDQKDQLKMLLIFQKITDYKKGFLHSLQTIQDKYISKSLNFDETIRQIKRLFNMQNSTAKDKGIPQKRKFQSFDISILSIRYLTILQNIIVGQNQKITNQEANKLLKEYQISEHHLKYRGVTLLLMLLIQKGKYLQAQGLIGFCEGQLYNQKSNQSQQSQQYYFNKMLKGLICSDKPSRHKEAQQLIEQSLKNLDTDKLLAEIMLISQESVYLS